VKVETSISSSRFQTAASQVSPNLEPDEIESDSESKKISDEEKKQKNVENMKMGKKLLYSYLKKNCCLFTTG
jgi:hypothetical protein